MVAYPIVAVLWDDHQSVSRGPLVKNPDKSFKPTLSIGLLYKETKKTIILIHDIEPNEDRDDYSYLVIFKSCVASIKEYGTIELRIKRS